MVLYTIKHPYDIVSVFPSFHFIYCALFQLQLIILSAQVIKTWLRQQLMCSLPFPLLFLECKSQGTAQIYPQISITLFNYFYLTLVICDMVQEKFELQNICKFINWCRSYLKFLSCFKREVKVLSQMGRLHYDSRNHSGESKYWCLDSSNIPSCNMKQFLGKNYRKQEQTNQAYQMNKLSSCVIAMKAYSHEIEHYHLKISWKFSSLDPSTLIGKSISAHTHIFGFNIKSDLLALWFFNAQIFCSLMTLIA